MLNHSAEYEALDRVVTADKRYRKFQYLLTALFFALVVWGAWSVQHGINKKIDHVIKGATVVAKAREEEQKTVARETIRYITCIFVVPIDQRTPDTQQRCFEAADLPGGLTRKDFSPVVIPIAALGGASNVVILEQPSQSSAGDSSLVIASPDSSTNNNTVQPENPQSGSSPQAPPRQTTILQPTLDTVQNALKVIDGNAQ
jgi:hypothetical protein